MAQIPHMYILLIQVKCGGTTFKIDTGSYVFSCLFDSGTEIICMNMDMIAALRFLGKMVNSSVTVNTASGQNMGVAGDMYITFKIGRC